MTDYLQRFAEYYAAAGYPVELFDGSLWVEHNRMVMPVGPATLDHSISTEAAHALLSRFPHAVLVRYSDGFDTPREAGEWYAVICNKFRTLEDHTANQRSKIHRALRRCVIQKVEAECIASKGYDVFMSAFTRYKNVSVPKLKEDVFRQRILLSSKYDDIIEYWGVFCEGKLAGYSQNYIYGTTEVNYSSVKLHPDYLKSYTSYSLMHSMNEYYLCERPFAYVNDGFRRLLHQTEFQEFLINIFGFKKAYTNLFVHYKPLVKWLVSLPSLCKLLLGTFNAKAESLFTLDSIRIN
jgi:hypothetical protein